MPRHKMKDRIPHILLVMALALSCLAPASSQGFSSRQVGNKTIQCVHSGIVTELEDCGLKPFPYDMVFVGSIAAIQPAAGDELELRIVPEEVFSGHPESSLTVLTVQGLCFPAFKAGDRWLFYLQKPTGKPVVLDYYANRSLPLVQAQSIVENFRRLQKIGQFALVRGQVLSGEPYHAKPVAKLPVRALRKGDLLPYTAITDETGRYEFPPLPPGYYVIQIRADQPHQPGDWPIDLSPAACWDLTPDRIPRDL